MHLNNRFTVCCRAGFLYRTKCVSTTSITIRWSSWKSVRAASWPMLFMTSSASSDSKTLHAPLMRSYLISFYVIYNWNTQVGYRHQVPVVCCLKLFKYWSCCFTQPTMRRMRICFTDVFCFFSFATKIPDNRSQERLNGFSWNFYQTIAGKMEFTSPYQNSPRLIFRG